MWCERRRCTKDWSYKIDQTRLESKFEEKLDLVDNKWRTRIFKLTSRPVGICLANLTLAKFPFPMVFMSLYLPIWTSSVLDELDRPRERVLDELPWPSTTYERNNLSYLNHVRPSNSCVCWILLQQYRDMFMKTTESNRRTSSGGVSKNRSSNYSRSPVYSFTINPETRQVLLSILAFTNAKFGR